MFRVLTVATDLSVSHTAGSEDVRPDGDLRVRWIDLEKQDEHTLAVLAERFGFHPLTIEDCSHFDQRPKLESYEDYLFVVFHGFEVDWDHIDDAQVLELHMFVGRDFVVTVHERPLPALEAVWNRVALDGRLLHHGADQLCYLIADALIDSYFPLLDDLLLRVDRLEDRVLDHVEPPSLAEILDFKRLLVELRKILSPQRDVLALLAKRGEGLISERVSIYFRDVLRSRSASARSGRVGSRIGRQRPRRTLVERVAENQRDHEASDHSQRHLPPADIHHGLFRTEL